MQKLTRSDIQNFFSDEAEKLAPKTLAEMHMIIKNVLSVAVDDMKLVRNPCNKIELPKIVEPAIRILSEEEMTAILTAAFNSKVYDVIFLEFATGMRRGEILGLEWDDVNFETNNIRISKQWVLIKGKPCWSDASTGTKTESSNRTIAVPQETIETIKRRYEKNPNDKYVFQSSNGNPIDPGNFRRDFKKYVKKAAQNINEERLKNKKNDEEIELVNLDNLRFHDLRHNYATQLVALNIHTRLIQAQLGHKDGRATRRYTHATEQGQHDAAEKIGRFLTTINSGCCQVAVKHSSKAIKASGRNAQKP